MLSKVQQDGVHVHRPTDTVKTIVEYGYSLALPAWDTLMENGGAFLHLHLWFSEKLIMRCGGMRNGG
jgi:hypothetical protein